MPMEQLAANAARKQERTKELEAELKQMKSERDEMFRALLERMLAIEVDGEPSPMQQISAAGQVLYVYRTLVASVVDGDHDGLNDAMKKAGFEDLVRQRIMPQTLSAWVRELEQDENGNPVFPTPELYDVLEVKEIVQLRAKKA